MLIPTAAPARMHLSQNLDVAGVANAAKARKNIPTVNAREPRPQHTWEKMFEFKAAARPPSRHARRLKPNCRKKSHAQTPRTNMEKGARIRVVKRAQNHHQAARPIERCGPAVEAQPVQIMPGPRQDFRKAEGRAAGETQRTIVGKDDFVRMKTVMEQDDQHAHQAGQK